MIKVTTNIRGSRLKDQRTRRDGKIPGTWPDPPTRTCASPGWVRHDHAQDPGHSHRRPAAASRPPRPDRRGFPPPRRGPGRKGSGHHALNTPGRPAGHPPGYPVTVSQEITRPPERISSRPLTAATRRDG